MPPSIEEKGLSQIWHKSTFNIVQSEISALIFANLLPDNAGNCTAVAEGCTITMLYKEKVPQERLPANETKHGLATANDLLPNTREENSFVGP